MPVATNLKFMMVGAVLSFIFPYTTLIVLTVWLFFDAKEYTLTTFKDNLGTLTPKGWTVFNILNRLHTLLSEVDVANPNPFHADPKVDAETGDVNYFSRPPLFDPSEFHIFNNYQEPNVNK